MKESKTFRGAIRASVGAMALFAIVLAFQGTAIGAPPVRYTLSVTKAGTGAGRVASTPGGINCGEDCSSPFGAGTSVTLTAAPS